MRVNYLPVLRIWILFFILAFSSASRSTTPDVLIKISITQWSQLSKLIQSQLEICYHDDSSVLITVNNSTLSNLATHGLEYEILDSNAWSLPYYLIRDHDEIQDKKIIYRNNNEAVIKISDRNAVKFVAEARPITRIFKRALPFKIAKVSYYQDTKITPLQSNLMLKLVNDISESNFREYLQRLQDFRTRFAPTDSTAAVIAWLQNKFKEFGYANIELDTFDEDVYNSTQHNVIVTKYGSSLSERVIVIGGHYDSIVHFGSDVNPWDYAPGVDDNGTGAAGTLELARVLAETNLETTVIFVPFACEELGLWGSEYYARTAFERGMNIMVMFNMDMIANVDDDVLNLNIRTDERSRPYAMLVSRTTKEYTDLIPELASSSGGSDHFYFLQYGYPALFIQEGDFSPHWHRNSDVIDNVDIVYGAKVLKGLVAAVVMLANSPDKPDGLASIAMGNGTSQILLWHANEEPDLASYNIYLGSTSGHYDKIIKGITAVTDTVNGLIEDQPVYAAVSAVDKDGNESMLSSEITFTPSRFPVTPLGFESTSLANAVKLIWQNNNNEVDFEGYTITRFEPNSLERTFLANMDSKQFLDDSVELHILYKYVIQARDSQGNLSAPSQITKGQLATRDCGILIIDGTKDGSDQLLRPSDKTVDQFYEKVLNDYQVTKEWDLADSSIKEVFISDADLAIYSTVIYHSDVWAPSYKISADTSAIKKYLDNGGKLLLIGWGLIENITANLNEVMEFHPGQFVYDYLKLEKVIKSARTDNDFAGAISVLGDYPSLTLSSEKVPISNNSLFAMELFETPFVDQFSQIPYPGLFCFLTD